MKVPDAVVGLGDLLELTESLFLSDLSEVAPEDWHQLVNRCLVPFTLWVDEQVRLGTRRAKGLLSGVKSETIWVPSGGLCVLERRMRPDASYYSRTGTRLPMPEDPDGPSACGLSVSLQLYRGYYHHARGHYVPAEMVAEFSVWGYRERAAFGELLRDHRRTVERLLGGMGLAFTTSCVFDNVERLSRAPVFNQLEAYYKNDLDPENCFTLERPFGSGDNEAEIVALLRCFLILYKAALGYSQVRRNRDQIYKWLPER